MSNIGRTVLRPERNIEPGKPFLVKTLVKHPQYNGIMKGDDGKPIPKDFISTINVFYGSDLMFSIKASSSLSINPKLNFWLKVDRSDTLKVVWIDNKGNQAEEKVKLKL